MRVQVNSDNTVSVDVRVKQFVKGEVERILENFADRVTRVEVHLSDVNKSKSGPGDKRCVVEVRPAGAKPLSTHATADAVPAAIVAALRKMKRSLTSYFGRQGRAVAGRSAAAPRATTSDTVERRTAARKTTVKKAAVKKAAATKAAPGKAGPVKRTAARTSTTTKKAPASRKATASEATVAPAASPGRTPKKKGIFLARRKAWPTR